MTISRDKNLLDYIQSLKDYVSYNNYKTPVMVTYTTTLSNSLKAKFTVKRMFMKMINTGRSKLPFRETYAPPVCWSIEESVASVHVHALYDGWQALRTHQTIWNTVHLHDTGRAYVSSERVWNDYIDYIHKSFVHINKFFGHFVALRKKTYISRKHNMI